MWRRRRDEYDVFDGFGQYGRIWNNPQAWNGEPDETGAPEHAAGDVGDVGDVGKAGGVEAGSLPAVPPAERDLVAGLRAESAPPVRRSRRGLIAVSATLGVATLVGALAIGLEGPASRPATERARHEQPAAVRQAPVPPPESAAPTRSLPPPAPAQAPVIPRGAHGKVVVLDQSKVPTLAQRMTRRLEAAGWEVTGSDDFRGKVPATTVYHPADQAAQAHALAAELPGIGRIKPAFAGIPLNRLTVIVVDDQVVPLVDRLLGSLSSR